MEHETKLNTNTKKQLPHSVINPCDIKSYTSKKKNRFMVCVFHCYFLKGLMDKITGDSDCMSICFSVIYPAWRGQCVISIVII